MNEIKLFENVLGNVRATVVDGDVYFVASDVATCLGYAKPNNAVNIHCKGATLKQGIIDNLGRTQQVNCINERDVLRLIVKSKLPEAEKFESWVFDEVIPTVLKTGKYEMKTPEQEYLEMDENDRAIAFFQQRKQLQLVQPKVEAFDRFMNHDGTYTTRNACKMLKLPEKKVFEWLREKELVFKRKTEATSKGVENGYFKQIIKNNYSTMVITPKGIDFIKNNFIQES